MTQLFGGQQPPDASAPVDGETLPRQPLSQTIASRLRDEIARQYQPGDRLPTEAGLAARFQVSNHTVREALGVLAREGWVRRRQGSGTFAARPSPQPGSSDPAQTPKRVAVRIEQDLTDPRLSSFYLRVLYSLQQILIARGRDPRLYPGRITTDNLADRPEPCPELIADAAAGRLSGIVAIGTMPDESWIEPMRRAGVPLVGTVEHYEHSVRVDRKARLEAGVELLAEAGCRRLALIGWHDFLRPPLT
ncbi:MAG: GntR family transcriptional regulator, partial [bacterium]